MQKYRLLVGQHIQNDPETKSESHPRGIEVTYNAGDTFVSDTLLEKFNSPGHSPKFERLQDDVKVETVQQAAITKHGDPYDTMTVAQLQAHAAAEEIDVRRARTKDDIIRLIRAADAAAS